MNIVISFFSICMLLLAGKILRVNIKLLRNLYLPASVIGGIIGLIVIQAAGRYIPQECTSGWNKLPGFLINIVFATIFLGVKIPSFSKIWKSAGPQLAYGQIVAWGQYTVGIGMTMFLLTRFFAVPNYFGVIVPIGFEGGHGTAAGLKSTLDTLGWQHGADFALASASVGIISAIVVGMFLVNWAVRRGYTAKLRSVAEIPETQLVGIYNVNQRPSAGKQTVCSGSIDTLALHIAVIGIAVFVGFIFKQAIVSFEHFFPVLSEKKILQAFPLFPLCMLGGFIVQLVLSKFPKLNLVDHQLMQRLSGTALDFLIVAAISLIQVDVIAKGIIPFSIVIFAGILWNMFCVMWLAKRLLPDAWFERAIVEMGQSMGVTATGLLLLRIVDPEAETKTFSSFGYKQLLHEPIMGGGIWTSIAIPLAIIKGPSIVIVTSVTAILIWLCVWSVMFRKTSLP